jgi:hypothetical protein
VPGINPISLVILTTAIVSPAGVEGDATIAAASGVESTVIIVTLAGVTGNTTTATASDVESTSIIVALTDVVGDATTAAIAGTESIAIIVTPASVEGLGGTEGTCPVPFGTSGGSLIMFTVCRISVILRDALPFFSQYTLKRYHGKYGKRRAQHHKALLEASPSNKKVHPKTNARAGNERRGHLWPS